MSYTLNDFLNINTIRIENVWYNNSLSQIVEHHHFKNIWCQDYSSEWSPSRRGILQDLVLATSEVETNGSAVYSVGVKIQADTYHRVFEFGCMDLFPREKYSK